MPVIRSEVGQIPAADVQRQLPLDPIPALAPGVRLQGLDLFSGIGGFSAGFAELGFSMVGLDSEAVACECYTRARFGEGKVRDLSTDLVIADVPVVIGGPPCRPWSPVNLQKRAHNHQDYGLIGRFVDHVEAIRPVVFIMENVPALRSDAAYEAQLGRLRASGYDIAANILRYDLYGAASRRRRLFTVGVLGHSGGSNEFFRMLQDEMAAGRTVRDAIHRFRDSAWEEIAEHDWSQLRTISKYQERYASGQYGWRKLDYDLPAPSFGSVAKTYILHPEAGSEGFPERVLSVREVMAIMGFADTVRFPAGTSRAKRYQMVANSVSPQVSRAIASTVIRMLTGVRPPPGTDQWKVSQTR